jgi:hypothetical protein
MNPSINRRDFLRLAGLGGVVFASRLSGLANAASRAGGPSGAYDDFFFVQLSDTHWGFEGPPNPDAKGTLKKAVAAVNSLAQQPDFIVFTGDLTHTTDDPHERRKRLGEFRDAPCESQRRRHRAWASTRRLRCAAGDYYAVSTAPSGGRYALCTMCIGVGQGIAMIIERV